MLPSEYWNWSHWVMMRVNVHHTKLSFLQLTFAAEVLQKLGDWDGLVNMYIGAQQWEEVSGLCRDVVVGFHHHLSVQCYFAMSGSS